MHPEDSGDDMTDSDAEMDIEDAQNLPARRAGSLASLRHALTIQETQEEDPQAEMEELEP